MTMDVTYWIAFSAGMLSFFSPCVLPLLPSYITYITGLSFSQLQEAHPGKQVRWTVLVHCLLFIAGFSTVFIALGALAGLASASFQGQLRESLGWIQKLGGVLIFLFGVHISGLFRFGILLGDKRIHIHAKPAGFLGTFLVGVAFAAGWTPCIGPILGAILTLAAGASGSPGRGILLLATYSAGMGIPFLVSGLLFHAFLEFFNTFRKYIRLVEIFTGILLMIVGVMLFFNMFGIVTGYLYQILPVNP
ncbi:MAG: cytochrome c biogenesis CcdA family protein [Syntrophotaleaceae bacterium]